MRRTWFARAAILLAICALAAGAANHPARAEASARRAADAEETELKAEMKMNVQIGEETFAATLEDNVAVRALVEMMRRAPVSIEMRDYSGFEKVGALERSLPTDDRQTTTAPGDIVLYSGDQIVLFYGTNAWSYTRIGRIDALSGWEEALGAGDVTAVFSIAE